MNFNYKSCLLILGSFCLTTSMAIPANALDNYDSNNPNKLNNSPIRLAQSKSILKDTSTENGNTSHREYTFKAPDSKKISNTEQLVKVQDYKVEVYGTEEELLQQVKDIEPTAFIKGNTIQVGIFSKEANAQNLVQKLAIRGFWARIKTQ